MVGYMGHVPRARDKVEGSPLGNLPGTPVSPNKTSPNFAQTSGVEMDPDRYTSEARAAAASGILPSAQKPQLYGQGAKPGYGGHGAKSTPAPLQPPPAAPHARRPPRPPRSPGGSVDDRDFGLLPRLNPGRRWLCWWRRELG